MLAGEVWIEAGGGLVGQDDAGLLGQRAGDGHSLLLATRQRIGAPVGQLREANLAQAFEGELAVAAGELPEEAWPRGQVAESAGKDVLEHGGAPDKVELLEDHADAPAHVAQGPRVGPRHRPAVHWTRARRGLHQAIDRPQEGGLPGSAPPDDDDELGALDREVHAVEGDGGRGRTTRSPRTSIIGASGAFQRPRGPRRWRRTAPRGVRTRRRGQRGRAPRSSTAARTGS